MNLFGVLDVSGSALKAERQRAEVVAANLANMETTRTPEGGPYRRKHVVFTTQEQFGRVLSDKLGRGVAIRDVVPDSAPAIKRYEPGHPDADAEGYVSYPAINPVEEMVDLMGATRAYGLNASAVTATKQMIQQSLEILK